MTLTQPLFICPRAFVVIAAALLAVAHDIKLASGQDWPTRSLTLVVPWAAGGGTDVMGRIMARRMSEILGQQVIVENVAGAGGMMGSARAAKAAPDGYTFVFGSRSDAINMTLYKHPTYSLQNDLAPVVLVADQPTILVARKDLPVEGLSDFIAYVQRNASIIRLGSAGIGATGFVDCAIFNGMIGVNIQAIPYRGSGPAMQDLIRREFDYFCTISGSAAQPLQNDLIKGIAVFTAAQRDRRLGLVKLVLKRASASRSSGEWNDDDFEVLADGAVVGRMFKVHAAPVGTWTLAYGHHEDRSPTHGYEPTREAAMAAFAKSWRND